MDQFAQLPTEERQLYFQQAVARLGRLTAQLVEKDFWVCWTLKRLFSLDEFGSHLTFKGGTSLSKVYRVIERFSEDLDVSIERGFLGFGGENEPENGQSGKEQQRRVKKLKKACQAVIVEKIQPQLESAIGAQLGASGDWRISLDLDDPDRQTLLFHFPPAIRDGLSPYFARSVKIELGARSDHYPVEDATLSPYLYDAIPEALDECQVTVRVLCVTRTFWEKATILHVLHHQPIKKPIRKGQSRHLYDLYRLAKHDVCEKALADLGLLRRVAQFKSVFFKSSWAKYDEAKPGTLRLVPTAARMDELKRDYQSMEPMFFGDAIEFEEIISGLAELQCRINAVDVS
ncbi:MAG: nucleotidyl transferase AbiEii/AbiGii toxin family protein [Planctomycetes bacterium]|nr:nucleotidyl transferase AbiEii/AbiGii toxin family protein [Planctomycetota bacterium]